MITTTVYGASDDLIEIEGQLHEEFGCYGLGDDDESGFARLMFSDGTILSVRYDANGIWRFGVECKGASEVAIEPCADPTGESCHTDKVTLTGDLKWVGLVERNEWFTYARKAP